MSKRILYATGALVLVMIISACATVPSGGSSRQKPQWLENPESLYPQDTYLVAVGEGDSLKKAKADAAGTLSRVFQTTIRVENTFQTRYTELMENGVSKGSQEEVQVDENIVQLTDQELVNVHFSESWTDDSVGRVYAIGYIQRMETANIYRARIMENSDQVSYLLSRADEKPRTLEKFGFTDAAIVIADNNEMLLSQLQIIHLPMSKTTVLPYDKRDMIRTRSELAEGLRISISVQGDEDERITNLLSDMLAERGFTITDSGILSVNGNVRFEDADLDNGYENIRWLLSLKMVDEQGSPFVALEENRRESGISREQALARCYRSIEEAVQNNFLGQMTAYLDSFVSK